MSLVAAAGDYYLRDCTGLGCLSNEVRALSVLIRVGLTVVFVSYSTEVKDGLNVVKGGFPPILERVESAELGFSLSYLFKYVIKFSFDFKLSYASCNLVFKVVFKLFSSPTSILSSSHSFTFPTDSLINSSIFYCRSALFCSVCFMASYLALYFCLTS